jgi:hypothetical protein
VIYEAQIVLRRENAQELADELQAVGEFLERRRVGRPGFASSSDVIDINRHRSPAEHFAS